jgi:phytanoyl-CoA hydroxylase
MLIFKQPYVGGEVVPHQDSSFLCTSPLSCVGIWLALEDATQTNGCMWTLPGAPAAVLALHTCAICWAWLTSHNCCQEIIFLKLARHVAAAAAAGSHLDGVHRRFVRAPDGTVSFEGDMPEFEEAAFVPLEAKAGSLVLLHGANVHTSKENNSPVSRHAYTMHFVESAPGYTYATDNWLQRRAEVPFEPLYDVSGSSSTPETPPAFAQPPHRSRQAVTAQS